MEAFLLLACGVAIAGVFSTDADVEMRGWICTWITAASVGGAIGVWFGNQRNRPLAGFWLGLLLGPFGWLLTLLLPSDGRAGASASGTGRCPTCGGGLIGRYSKCPHCASDVFWVGGVPTGTPEEAADEQK
jgi:hypothetical protein